MSRGAILAVSATLALAATRAAAWPSWLPLGSRQQLQPRMDVSTPQEIWVPTDEYSGENFFDGWDFFSDKDPTNGNVNYLPREQCMREENPLAFVNEQGQAVMRIDNWTSLAYGQNRDSVRIESKKTYNSGLFLIDVSHVPTGCTVWPAFWTLGRAEGWPNAGEIDIIEGVHNNQRDQVTWHTGVGCNLTAPGNFSGTAIHTNCYANEVGGCGIVEWSQSSFGPTFNAFGGGVYAMKWTEDSIDVWFFYRATVPQDIVDGHPDPSYQNWGLPSASMSKQGCDLDHHFRDHAIIFTATICGDWAGNSYQADGCPGNCIERVMDPNSFNNATWILNWLRVYERKTLQGRVDSALGRAFVSASAAAAALCLLAFGVLL